MKPYLLSIICSYALIAVGACSGRTSGSVAVVESEEKLPIVDVTKEYPKKEINIQDIADLEYISLETTKESLLDGGALGQLACSDSLIVTCNRMEGKVLIFSRTGKFLHSFSHLGNGANEYIRLSRYSVDFNSNEIFIVDIFLMHRILVYSLDGFFKRTLILPKEISPYIYNYNNDSLLIYDSFRLDNAYSTKNINNRPYALLSKKDGKMTTFNFVCENRIGNSFSVRDKIIDNTAYGRSYMVGIFPLSKNGSQIFVSDFVRDTIYSLDRTGFTPLITRTPTVTDSQKTILFSISFRTNRYTLMSAIEKNLDRQKGEIVPVYRNFMYDRQTGEIYTPIFYTLDYSPKRQSIVEDNYFADLPENYARHILSAEILVQAYKEGHLVGELKEFASKLHEDDNPVLILIKFKE